MAVDVKTDKTFSAGVPHELFSRNGIDREAYDVQSDGKRFLIATSPTSTVERTITVVLNWWADLKN